MTVDQLNDNEDWRDKTDQILNRRKDNGQDVLQMS